MNADRLTARRVRLGDIADVRWGDTQTTKAAYRSEGFLAYSAAGPDGFMDHFDHDGPGIVLSAIGAQCGKTWYAYGRWSCIKNTIYLKGQEGAADTRFLYYATALPDFWPKRGAAQPFISQGDARNCELILPALPTQRRIASILGAYDDLIEVNRRRIAVLEEMARGLFEEWFVRFRFPGHESVPIEDTPDGPLPKGWTWKPFSALADFINGFAFKPSHFGDEGLPIVKIPELKNGVSAKTPRNCGHEVPDRLHIKDGDLLFSWSGTFAISEWAGGGALLNQHLFAVTPRLGWCRGFIKEALISALPKFDNQGVGAIMKHIRRSALDQTVVAIPSNASIVDYANRFFGAQYAQLVTLRRANQHLAAARDLLLPRLISGQLSVTQAECELEAAS